jgi:hypothetical protein
LRESYFCCPEDRPFCKYTNNCIETEFCCPSGKTKCRSNSCKCFTLEECCDDYWCKSSKYPFT